MNDSLLRTSSPHRSTVKQVSKKLKKFGRIKKESGEEDIKDYAANTMNELLGWYGYDKFDSRDRQSLRLASASSDDSASPKSPNTERETRPSDVSAAGGESTSCDRVSIDVEESSSEPVDAVSSHSPNEPMTEDHNSKESNEDASSSIPAGYIRCAWCQKVGIKLFTLRTTNGCKAFCSELCFTQCRRASFKKNKVCDFCRHTRHTVNYVDFQDAEQQLQFCSDKCLNQYKMNIFCEETHSQLQLHPQLQESSAKYSSSNGSEALITPDLWMRDCKRDDSNECRSGECRSSECRGSDHSDTERDQPQESNAPSVSLKRKVMEPINNKNGNSKEIAINFARREKDRESKRQKHSSYLNGNNENSRRFAAKESRNVSSNGNQNHVGLMHYKPMSVFASRNAAALHGMSNFAASSHVAMPSPVGSQVTHSAFSSPSAAPTANSYFGSLPVNGAASRDQIRPPLISPAFVPPHLNSSYTEMLRTQRGMRNPMPPFVNSPIPGQPFAGLHHMRPPNLTRIPHPSPPAFPHPYYPSNSPLMPPVTVMVPCPFFWPVPIPIPIPFPIPVRKECEQSSTDFGVQVNSDCFNERLRPKSTSNGMSNTDSSNVRKVDSLLTKLVEKRSKTNPHELSSTLNVRPNLYSMETATRSNNNSNSNIISDNNPSMDSQDLPQNLMIASRANRRRET